MTISIQNLKKRSKGDAPLVCLTAYSAPMARLLAPHVDLLLVGDSVGMVLYGMADTTGVNLHHMIAHGRAVVTGAGGQAIIVVDMPFGSYEDSDALALDSAKRIISETGCDAVKLEGGAAMAPRIKMLTDHNIPVIAHVGLLPQSAPAEGGFKVKGKTDEQSEQLKQDIIAVEKAGASAVVIEGTIERVAAQLSAMTSIPTIGIGASSQCDGQILVTEDMLGLSGEHIPKFVKQYALLGTEIERAAASYAADVRARAFPEDQYTYQGKVT